MMNIFFLYPQYLYFLFAIPLLFLIHFFALNYKRKVALRFANFDAIAKKDNSIFYFNLKFICGAGGAQTRSLREVYHFIRCQISHIQKNKCQNM